MEPISLRATLPLLAVGSLTLLLSFFFCCYLWRLRRSGREELGYKQVSFNKNKRAIPNETCAVCLEDFKSYEKIALCRCKHAFHSTCLVEWLDRSNTCPMCKQQVRAEPGECTRLVYNLPSTNV